jgi:hypothetical protein
MLIARHDVPLVNLVITLNAGMKMVVVHNLDVLADLGKAINYER